MSNYANNIKIVSLRGKLSSEPGWVDVRLDRTSLLGNPFIHAKENLRSQCIAAFRKWLWACIKSYQANEGDTVIDPAQFLVEGLSICKTWKRPTAGQVVHELAELEGALYCGYKLRLLCWCGEGRCHLDVVKNCLLWMLSN